MASIFQETLLRLVRQLAVSFACEQVMGLRNGELHVLCVRENTCIFFAQNMKKKYTPLKCFLLQTMRDAPCPTAWYVITGEQRVRIILDTGSQRSYFTKEIFADMGYQSTGKEGLRHDLFGGNKSNKVLHQKFQLTLGHLHMPTARWVTVEEELQDLGVKIDYDDSTIQELVGADILGRLLTGEYIVLKINLVAIDTYLGSTRKGAVHNLRWCPHVFRFLCLCTMGFRGVWIEDPERLRTKEKRISATWKHFEDDPLPMNLELKQKLNNLKVRDVNSEDFKDWERERIIEENEGYYQPYRPVLKDHGTTKVTPVFDTSSRIPPNPSLNDCLEERSNLIESIPHLILWFRVKPIGVIADIKKASLQIDLSERDRDFVYFLWKNQSEEVTVWRHTRVVFGVTYSPFLLRSVIEQHLKTILRERKYGMNSYSEETIGRLQRGFYVDNCVTSVERETLRLFIKESTQIFQKAGFDLRGWQFSDLAVDPEKMS
ncbi:hypothetical protein PR048_025285 [Dryococelus australis]|uniref:Polyprotein n=1 Tax=Dryococelus australis TaxID=614101 RepID=A0ABQ9GQY9_9NEOP|nr:hypothetical protein PR048_025285 [Dryococelus australis]